MMRLQNKVGFIGAGATGSAIVKGLLSKQLVGEKDIVVAEMMQGVREKLAKETNVRTSAESADTVVGCEVTVPDTVRSTCHSKHVLAISSPYRLDASTKHT
ncbi:hypothetical protein DIPPA_14310 [Diplonema papillatum]|nr:hypothetical protein DIPPA_14310 [Diplonema papillatum]